LPQLALALAVGLFALCFSTHEAGAQSRANDKVRIGFSNLIARLDTDEIGIAKAEMRVHILEALRAAGHNAVGAESLVFDRDESDAADLLLGGTVLELECRDMKFTNRRCRIGVDWEVLARDDDEVVYRVMTRYAESNIGENPTVAARRLLLGALRSLMARRRFAALLAGKGQNLPASDESYPAAEFRACAAGERPLPAEFDAAAEGTLLIKGARGFGSGFALGPDGLVLTAAHVVSEKTVEIRSRNGAVYVGHVVRLSRKYDVALVALEKPPAAGLPCLDLELVPPNAGADTFAIGSPASQELAFSLTRGIVSGLRLLDGVALIQTDASLSPGNSGGPLLNAQGRVVGVVSRKIAGQAVEGLGFAVQIADGLRALGLQAAVATSSSLLAIKAIAQREPQANKNVRDVEDPLISLDPEGDRRAQLRADYQRRVREQKKATSWFVRPMRWAGLTTAVIGGIGILASSAAVNSSITKVDFEEKRTQNDVSWGAFLVGGAAFVVSFPLEPPLPPPRVTHGERRRVASTVAAPLSFKEH
jgi:S1-C subfamily serine protease